MPGQGEVCAYLGLGGNLGDPRSTMAQALRRLDEAPGVRVVSVSSLYRTPPWGRIDQPDFLNAVAAITTTLAPGDLLALCLSTELALKRVRRERWGPRLIDIDILLYKDMSISVEGLEIPHPRMTDRAFVIAPLSEIAPALVLEGRSVSDRLADLDTAGIQRIATSPDWWRAEDISP